MCVQGWSFDCHLKDSSKPRNDNDHSFVHLQIRKALTRREDQSERAFGLSVPLFKAVARASGLTGLTKDRSIQR